MRSSWLLVAFVLIGCGVPQNPYPGRPVIHDLEQKARKEHGTYASNSGRQEVTIWFDGKPGSIVLPIHVDGVAVEDFSVSIGSLVGSLAPPSSWAIQARLDLPDATSHRFEVRTQEGTHSGELAAFENQESWSNKLFDLDLDQGLDPQAVILTQRMETRVLASNVLTLRSWVEYAYVSRKGTEWKATFASSGGPPK